MNRRQYLKLVGATVTAGALAGCGQKTQTEAPPTETAPQTGGQSTAEPTSTEAGPYGFEFDTVLDAVADLGMDPTGEEPIDDALDRFISRTSTLLEVPPGRYRFEEDHVFKRADTLGIRGTGEHRRKAVFWSRSNEGRQFLNVRKGGNGLLLENVSFDHGNGPGSIGNILRLDDNLRVENVEHLGFNPISQNGAIDNLSPQILTRDGTAIVNRFMRTGPSDIVSHGHLDDNSNAGCIWLGEDHLGTLVISRSVFKNMGTNAIYCSRTPGGVEVRNCTFTNNNQSSLRIGGRGSLVKNCTFTVDTANARKDNRGEFINPNGIVWETGNLGLTGGSIEGCTFVFESGPSDRSLSGIWADGSAGAFSVRDCRFVINMSNGRAIRIDDPQDPRLGVTAARPWGVTLSNIVVEGSVATKPTPLIEIIGRPNSKLANCCFSIPDDEGVVKLVASPESSLQDINVTGSGNWLTAETGEFVTENITRRESCTSPLESSD
jgi:predicted small lipoprotein YifL